jgi:hypothetical protein
VRIVVASDVENGRKLREDQRWKAFGEDVGVLTSCGNMQDFDMTEGNMFADEVEINLDVLRVLMMN